MTARVALCLVCLLGVTSNAGDLPPEDEHALQVLEEARAVARRAGEAIWPGFSLEKIPIAIFSGEGHAYLVHHPAPPPEFEPVSLGFVSTPVLRGPRTEAMNANTSGVLAGAVTAFVNMSSLGSGPVTAEATALVIHEAGHAFRERAPGGGTPRWPAEDSTRVSSYPSDSAPNNAWGRIEGAILADAIESRDAVGLANLTRDFLSVRDHRRVALDREMTRFEKHVELNEGLAEYFALRALVHPGPSDGAPTSQALTRLTAKLRRINAGGRGANRRRFYSTGAALGLVLDRLAPSSWKATVERDGATLEGALRDVVGELDAPARLRRLTSERRYEALLARELASTEAARARRRQRLVDVLAAPGTKLVLDLSGAGGTGRKRAFDPMNLVTVEPHYRVHTRMLTLEFKGGEASFQRPVVEDLLRETAITNLPADVTLALDPDTRAARVTGEGLSIACAEASWMRVNELLLLRPGPPSDLDPEPFAELCQLARAEANAPRLAPPFEVADLDGNLHELPEERSRATALVFFSAASWAKPSHRFVRELLSSLEPAHFATQRARLLLIASQCDANELESFLGDTAGTAVVSDPDRTLAELYRVDTYPTVVWIGTEGQVLSSTCGYREARVRDLIEELRPE